MATSSKYYWQGVDVKELTDTTDTDELITSKFNNFPAQLGNLNVEAAFLPNEIPSGMVTNNTNGDFNFIPWPNTSYFCYNNSEEETAPTFKAETGNPIIGSTSIFTTTFGNTNDTYSRIIVKSQKITHGSGTINIPYWVNGIKVKFISLRGNDGTQGQSVDASNVNHTTGTDNYDYHYHRDEHKNYDGGWVDNYHHNKDDHINEHHHNHNINKRNWTAKEGGGGGIGGNGKIGWYYKAILFDAGTNNTVTYDISKNVGGTSEVIVKEGNTEKAKIVYVNGTDGGNGGNATTATTNNTNTRQHHDNTQNRGDHNEDHHNNTNHHIREGSTPGTQGTSGITGNVTLTNEFKYLHYNSSLTGNNDPNQLEIYFFRFKSN